MLQSFYEVSRNIEREIMFACFHKNDEKILHKKNFPPLAKIKIKRSYSRDYQCHPERSLSSLGSTTIVWNETNRGYFNEKANGFTLRYFSVKSCHKLRVSVILSEFILEIFFSSLSTAETHTSFSPSITTESYAMIDTCPASIATW